MAWPAVRRVQRWWGGARGVRRVADFSSLCRRLLRAVTAPYGQCPLSRQLATFAVAICNGSFTSTSSRLVSAKLQTFGTPFRSDQIGLSELGRNDAGRLRDLPSTAMALSIGAEGTRKSPENGWLSSRIKKIALATANEPKASATSWREDADSRRRLAPSLRR
jgi:hypothetical protein